ncbi:MAG: protein kinase [Bryobacteraceae bacterium]
MQPATRFGPYEIIRRLGKRLDPRVIEIYEYGDLDGYFYVAMQYVEGRNLAEALKGDGRMSAYRAAHIAMEICGQLAKFHGFQPGDGTVTSVVHGDIKPSNIHLGLNETVRLLDFGIAKALRPNHDFTFHNFGSPSYCSPERLGRSLLDQQADLWAVGVTLYEMVAGSPPYQAEDTRKLERLIQSRRPPRALPASCPRPLKAIITKALAPDARRRYASAAAFSGDLKAFLEGQEPAAEKEMRCPWEPNPTRESGRTSKPRRAAPPRKTVRIAISVASALACVLAGMLLFIGTSYFARYWTASRQLRANLDYAHRPVADINGDWSSYQDLLRQFGFLGKYSPVDRLREPLRVAYQQAGAQVLDSYDRSSDADLRHFDWQKAEICLTRAMDLGASDRDTHAKLDLARGYGALQRTGLRDNARDQFGEAARDMPLWPDPHLGLARIHLLDSQPDRALAEFRIAEHLGYRMGARENAQRADAYRMRGFDELQAGNSTAARRDFDAAHSLNGGLQIPDIPPPEAPLTPPAHVRHKRPRRWR